MNYVIKLINQGFKANSIILLVGERQLSYKVDGGLEELTQLANSLGKVIEQLTETDLALQLYKDSGLDKLNINKYIIDTPKKNMQRPNTYTTLLELFNWMQRPTSPAINSILFVSNQPYVLYQKALTSKLIANRKLNLKFEVVGEMASDAIKAQELISALGSYIFANTAAVFDTFDLKSLSPKVQEAFKQLYGDVYISEPAQ